MTDTIMNLAWTFVRKNNMSMAEGLKVSWKNYKLRNKMKKRVVKFTFRKVDGSVREAYGTLMPAMLPETKGTGRPMPKDIQTYFDVERDEYRCFKKANLIDICW